MEAGEEAIVLSCDDIYYPERRYLVSSGNRMNVLEIMV